MLRNFPFFKSYWCSYAVDWLKLYRCFSSGLLTDSFTGFYWQALVLSLLRSLHLFLCHARPCRAVWQLWKSWQAYCSWVMPRAWTCLQSCCVFVGVSEPRDADWSAVCALSAELILLTFSPFVLLALHVCARLPLHTFLNPRPASVAPTWQVCVTFV